MNMREVFEIWHAHVTDTIALFDTRVLIRTSDGVLHEVKDVDVANFEGITLIIEAAG